MNTDDADSEIHPMKYPRLTIDYLPKLGLDFIRSLHNRNLQHHGKCPDLQAFAEDELVRKEYKEMYCEMPGVPRSTFLMVFSPDGTKVASTHGNHNIYITDLRTGKNLKTLIGHPRTPWCIAFHPSYNDIIASGCLGGQVRIWDLTGGSEIWTAENETVIASIAFHPIDRMLVIATFNELHFWDWSKPKPFACVATSNPKEKVRYVEFDKIGHKLITGITNVPHSRWDRNRNNSNCRVERGRFPLTPPSPPDRTAHHYRPVRAPVPRTVSTYSTFAFPQAASYPVNSDRVPMSTVPERERRITACYRNLVQEYELLVHRYLQVYSPPIMMDRGTDPMEIEEPTAGPSSASSTDASSSAGASTSNATPSTSATTRETPSAHSNFRIRCGLVLSRLKNFNQAYAPRNLDIPSGVAVKRRILVRASDLQSNNNDSSETPTSNAPNNKKCKVVKMRIKCLPKQVGKGSSNNDKEKKDNSLHIETTQPESSSATDRGSNSSGSLWAPHKRIYPGFTKTKKINRKPLITISSDDSSNSDGDFVIKRPPLFSEPVPSTSSTVRNIDERRMTVQQNESSEPIPSTSSRDEITHENDHRNENEICLPNFIAKGANNSSVCTVCTTTEATSTTTTETANTMQSLFHPGVPLMSTATTYAPIYTQSGGCMRLVRPPPNFFSIPQLRRNYYIQTVERNPSTVNLAQDEVINFAERPNSEDDLIEPPASNFHPFDPPPEFPSINPENIGIGNMYSNIVQDLESSLNNVRNIRASNRPGETSDMLSSFSDRLESIMQQSDTILRNLSISMDMLPVNTARIENAPQMPLFLPSPAAPAPGHVNSESPNVAETVESRLMAQMDRFTEFVANRNAFPRSSILDTSSSPTIFVQSNGSQVVLNNDFYIRNYNTLSGSVNPSDPLNEVRSEELFNDQNAAATDPNYQAENALDQVQSDELISSRNAVASDHTYHAEGPRVFISSAENLTPLMTSLHLTISHIRRQARLLRRQVDSIERIDRAMLEVAQLQSIRQLFGELRRHLSNLAGEHRSTGVSSVRQMMAGTRISDSGPGDSSAEHGSSSQNNSGPSDDIDPRSRQHINGRKQLPPSRLLHIQRQNRKFSVVNLLPRRGNTRNRYTRQRLYLRSFSIRQRLSDLSDHFGSTVTNNTLSVMIRRLETHLTAQMGAIGRPVVVEPTDETSTNFANEIGEVAINERLRLCRVRMNRIGNISTTTVTETTFCVTSDGSARFTARNTLSRILETLTVFLSQNASSRSIPQALHMQIRNVIDLTSLLSDVLLLHIVDSIPPPTGINLNPEREGLAASIDEMCNRILQRNVLVQSQSLSRSLRLMRLRTHYASHALDQIYNARCNAMLSTGSGNRRELLGQIRNTLHNIRNRGMSNSVPLNLSDSANNVTNADNEINENNTTAENNAMHANYTSHANNAAHANGTNYANPVNPANYANHPNYANHANYTSYPNFANQAHYSSPTTRHPANYANHTHYPHPGGYPNHSHYPHAANYANPINYANHPPVLSNISLQSLPIFFNAVRVSDSSSSGATHVVANSDEDTDGWYNDNRQSLYRTTHVNLVNTEEPAASSSNQSQSFDTWQNRLSQHRYRLSELRSNPMLNFFRPRFLHPLYAGGPLFDSAEIEDRRQDQLNDGEAIMTFTPNHRIQAWDVAAGDIPDISNSTKNIVVGECKIHNDASVDLSVDGTLLVTLLPSGGYLNVTNRLGVYSLRWESLGQILYITSFEQNVVSVSLSPLSRHLVVGLASRRVSIIPNEKWTMARIFLLTPNEFPYGSRLPVLRELEQSRDTSYMSLNCIRWLPVSGQGLIIATNTGQLRILS